MKFAYLIEPPFNYCDDTGEVLGCDVELAQYVFKKLGVDNFEAIETEFAELLPGVANGLWNMTTGLFSTQERRKTATFSRPIWALPDGLLVSRGNPRNLSGYRSMVQNSNCTLAVIRDQIQRSSAMELGIPSDRIAVFETYTEAATAVERGKVDAYASVERAHAGFVQRNAHLPLEVLTVPSSEKVPAFGSFAFNKSDNNLLSAVNDILDEYIGSTGHRNMMTKYGFSSEEVDLLIV